MKQTRSQQDMRTALDAILAINSSDNKEIAEKFGRLCHTFPIMVRTCGLCQAVAFSADKATSTKPDGAAHKLLLEQVAGLMGCDPDVNALLRRLQQADVRRYMLDTRQVLRAWIYWKRFAVSVLKVEGANTQSEDRV